MKQCPKCLNTHSKPGVYCCRTCANSRIFSEVSKKLKSIKSITAFGRLADEDLKLRSSKITETAKETKKLKLEKHDFDSLSVILKRERILIEQNYICNLCQQTLIWNGKPLKFHLDHISGNRKDETRNNLQMICPNCHSQTDTYGGKNGVKVTNKEIEDALATSENNHHVCAKVGLNPSAHAYNRINKIRENMLC